MSKQEKLDFLLAEAEKLKAEIEADKDEGHHLVFVPNPERDGRQDVELLEQSFCTGEFKHDSMHTWRGEAWKYAFRDVHAAKKGAAFFDLLMELAVTEGRKRFVEGEGGWTIKVDEGGASVVWFFCGKTLCILGVWKSPEAAHAALKKVGAERIIKDVNGWVGCDE